MEEVIGISSPEASNPSLALSRSTTVHVQRPRFGCCRNWACWCRFGWGIRRSRRWRRGTPWRVRKGTVVATPRVRILKQVGSNLFRAEELNRIRDPDARQVRMPVQAVARLAACHGLSTSGAFGAARCGL